MLPLNAHKERGFTLIEMIVVVIIAGVLAAVAIPSFEGMFKRTKINESLAQVEGGLKEVQREAMRRGKTCQVRLDKVQSKVINVPGSDPSERCLLSERDLGKLGSGVRMEFNGTGSNWDISYSFRGNMAGLGRTTVIYWDGEGNSATTYKKCLVMTNGTGILRTGEYKGTVSSITASNCQ